jgi:hypothetical protein
MRGWFCNLHVQYYWALSQCCHSWVQVPQNLGPHLTHSFETEFPFCRLLRLAGLGWRYSNLSPHRETNSSRVRVTLWLKVGQSVCLGVEPHLGLITKYLLDGPVLQPLSVLLTTSRHGSRRNISATIIPLLWVRCLAMAPVMQQFCKIAA